MHLLVISFWKEKVMFIQIYRLLECDFFVSLDRKLEYQAWSAFKLDDIQRDDRKEIG